MNDEDPFQRKERQAQRGSVSAGRGTDQEREVGAISGSTGGLGTGLGVVLGAEAGRAIKYKKGRTRLNLGHLL